MMPDHLLEPAKATGRVRRLARKAAVGLLQISLGSACLVGTYWGVTRFLAGDFERDAKLTLTGASAPTTASVLAVTAQVRATEMPEIKAGVPDLVPVRVSAAAAASDRPTIRNSPAQSLSGPDLKDREGSAVVDRASSDQPAPLHVKSPENESGPTLSSASSVPAVPPESRAITSAASEVSVSRPLQQVAATTLDGEVVKEAVSRVHLPEPERIITPALPEAAQQLGVRADREADKTAKVIAPTMGSSRTDAQKKGVAETDKRVGQRSQAQVAKRTEQSAVKASSSAREATTRSNAASNRNDKPATAQRTRVAAAPSEPSTLPASLPAAAEVAEQRVHLLGIPLPTGRKVRECLLEWRC
jgi:hypothetical protein